MIPAAYRTLTYLFWGDAGQTTAAASVARDGVGRMTEDDQNSPVTTALEHRTIYPLNSAAQRRVPEREALCALLSDQRGLVPAALGIALGLPSRELLKELSWCDRNAFEMVSSMLEQVCLPLSLVELADQLEKGWMRNGGYERVITQKAREAAVRLRSLAACREEFLLYSQEQMLFDEVVSVLSPLAGEPGLLETALGVPQARRHRPGSDAVLAPCYKTLEKMVDQDLELRRRQGMAARTCGEWMEVVARAGARGFTLVNLARHWQLKCPAGCEDWWDYRRSVLNTLTDELVRRHRRDHDAPVPLSQAWAMLYSETHWPCFALALDHAFDPRLVERQDQYQVGLFSLLSHAVAQGGNGRSVSGAVLCRLVRGHCVPLRFGLKLRCSLPVPETRSRPWRPSDVPRLVDWTPDAERHALEMAAVLGVGGASQEWPVPEERNCALFQWQHIYARARWLETGHLVRLFRLFGKRELLEKLTGASRSHDWDSPAGSPLPHRVVEFVHLARELAQLPGRMQGFVDLHRVDQHPGYLMLPASAQHWRVLNCLALDPLLLKNWYRFSDDQRAQQRTAQAEAAVADAQDLDKNSAGYPYDYICPISRSYMEDPVAIVGDNNVRRHFSAGWLLKSLTMVGPFNPLTRSPLYPYEVPAMVDQAHRARIHAWRVRHPELEENGEPFVPPGPALGPAERRCGSPAVRPSVAVEPAGSVAERS